MGSTEEESDSGINFGAENKAVASNIKAASTSTASPRTRKMATARRNNRRSNSNQNGNTVVEEEDVDAIEVAKDDDETDKSNSENVTRLEINSSGEAVLINSGESGISSQNEEDEEEEDDYGLDNAGECSQNHPFPPSFWAPSI